MPGGPIAVDDLAVGSHVSPRAPAAADGLVYLGHVVVEPSRRAAQALVTVAGAEHLYSASIGHHIRHLHVHLIPRYPQTPPSSNGTEPATGSEVKEPKSRRQPWRTGYGTPGCTTQQRLTTNGMSERVLLDRTVVGDRVALARGLAR